MPYNIYPGVDENYKFPPLIRQGMALYTELVEAFAGKYLEAHVSAHLEDLGNPHSTTKAQVGLSNADNTSDTNKPVSAATQTALNLKAPLASPAFTGTPTGITKTHVGLSNVDNTSDANKPVSSAQTTALNLKANAASPAFTGTPTGLTKSHVGLSNVDNTSDANKPVSTAQADLFVPRFKPSTAYIAGQQVVSQTNDVVAALANFTSTASYNAANWTTPASIGSIGKGQVALIRTPATSAAIAGTVILADYVTVNLVAGRRYTAKYRCSSSASVANTPMELQLLKSISTDTTAAGTLVEDASTVWTSTTASSGSTHFVEASWLASATETVNIKACAKRVFGTATLTIDTRRLLVLDEGAQF